MVELKREVPKETHELMQALVEITKAVKDSMADGKFDPATELPQIVVASMQHLMKAIEGIDKLDDEFKAELPGAIMAILIGGGDIAEIFLKK